MKIYVSGSISAHPLNEARAMFREAERQLKEQGHEVVCPFDNGLPDTASWERHVAIDILLLLGCQAIYMLQGWEVSRGATLERHIAIETGKIIWYEEQPKLGAAKDAIAIATGHSFCDLTGRVRDKSLVDARIIFAHHCSEAGMSVAEIADEMHKDTSTIGYYLHQYDNYLSYNWHFRANAERFEQALAHIEGTAQEPTDEAPHGEQ